MSVAQHSGTARPVRATLPCFANRVSAWPSRRNQPRVCKTLPSDSYSVSFGTQSGPTVSSNLNAGLLVPSQTSPSLWFRAVSPGKSHNHTAVDPATTQVFINHIGSANNTWVATNNKRFGRGDTRRPRPNLLTGGGWGLGGKPPAGLLAMSPFEFLFRGTREKPGREPGEKAREPGETGACGGTNARYAGLP